MEDMNRELRFVVYHTDETDTAVNAVVQNESIWVTQKAMADLFGVNTPAINKHLKNIYDEGELSETATVSKMEIVQDEGGRKVKRSVTFYNLDAIISVGYRVNSRQATKFRIWANELYHKELAKIKQNTLIRTLYPVLDAESFFIPDMKFSEPRADKNRIMEHTVCRQFF